MGHPDLDPQQALSIAVHAIQHHVRVTVKFFPNLAAAACPLSTDRPSVYLRYDLKLWASKKFCLLLYSLLVTALRGAES